MGRKILKKSRGIYKMVLLVVLLIAMLGVAVFVMVPRFSKPSWEQVRQMMADTDPAEDSGRLVLSREDKERINSADLEGSTELTDVSGTGVGGTIHAGFGDGKYIFYGEFQELPALSPGQSYQVWLVRNKPFEYIPAATMIVTDSASYQVDFAPEADLIDWQEVAAFAVADPASYMKWLRGESMDLAVRWAVAAETGPDGLGKTRATTYYGSSTDLTGYDRVVLTQEEPDGNLRPGKFMLQGKISSTGSSKSNLQFPIIYTQKEGGSLKGTQKCPVFKEESNLIFCGETESQANESLSAWKAGQLAKPSESVQDDEVLNTVCGQECIGQFDRESDEYSSCYAQCVLRECLKSFMAGGNCPDVQEGNTNDLPNGGEGPSSNGNSGGSYVVPR